MVIAELWGPEGLPSRAPYSYRKEKENPWIYFFVVIMASDDSGGSGGVAQDGDHTPANRLTKTCSLGLYNAYIFDSGHPCMANSDLQEPITRNVSVHPMFLSQRFHRPIYFQFEFTLNSDSHRNLSDQSQVRTWFNWRHHFTGRKTFIFSLTNARSCKLKLNYFTGKKSQKSVLESLCLVLFHSVGVCL